MLAHDPLDRRHVHIVIRAVERDFPALIAVEGQQILIAVALREQILPVIEGFQRSGVVRQGDIVLFEVNAEFGDALAAEAARVARDMLGRVVFVDVQAAGPRVDHHLHVALQVLEERILVAARRIALVVVVRRHEPGGKDVAPLQRRGLEFLEEIADLFAEIIREAVREILFNGVE